MWAAWIADGRETTAEIRGAEDHDVRREQRQGLGLRRLRGGRTQPLKPYREEEAARGHEPPTSPTPRAPRAGYTVAWGGTYRTDTPVHRDCSAADRNAGCALPPQNPHVTMEASGITMPEDNESLVKARRISHIMRQVRKRATVSIRGHDH